MPRKARAETNRNPKLQCQGGCDRTLARNKHNFYQSNNSIHNTDFYGGFAPICKGCMRSMCFDANNNIDINGLLKVLKLLDKPFIQLEYIKLLSEGNFDLGNYLKDISLNSYGNKHFIDSDNYNNEINNTKDIMSESNNFEITPELIIKWGKGYNKEDYKILENMYEQWTTKYKSDTLAEQKTFKFLCLKEFEIMDARTNNKPVDKLEDTYIKFMNAANVTPKDSNASDPDNMNSLGIWIHEIEKTRPAEYFKDKKIYKDFDSLTDYLQRFIFRPLKNLLTGSRDFDSEFNVEHMTDMEQEEDINNGS